MTLPAQTFVLITGATSGIGKHAAHDLADRGYQVFAAGRNPRALAELATHASGRITPIGLDVTSAASIASAKQTIDEATDGHGVDVLVNNAGYGDFAPLEMMSDEDLRAQYETNVFGLMAVTRTFLPQMRARGAGRIINVSSVGGLFTLPMMGAYNSSKYAVESLSDALRLELRPFGIYVSLIEPGFINTGFTDHSLGTVAKYNPPGSPYASVMERFTAVARTSGKFGVGPAVTSRAIYRAISRRRPRARYVVPFVSGRLGAALMRAIPTRLRDSILRRSVGLTSKRIAAARPQAQLDASRA